MGRDPRQYGDFHYLILLRYSYDYSARQDKYHLSKGNVLAIHFEYILITF